MHHGTNDYITTVLNGFSLILHVQTFTATLIRIIFTCNFAFCDLSYNASDFQCNIKQYNKFTFTATSNVLGKSSSLSAYGSSLSLRLRLRLIRTKQQQSLTAAYDWYHLTKQFSFILHVHTFTATFNSNNTHL
jgi:hypothetical protein